MAGTIRLRRRHARRREGPGQPERRARADPDDGGGELLTRVARLADQLRRDTVGDEVTYVVNRNIDFTDVCYVGCRFCAFAQRRNDADAYSLSLDQVADRAQEAWDLGATEVCMQGGIDQDCSNTLMSSFGRLLHVTLVDVDEILEQPAVRLGAVIIERLLVLATDVAASSRCPRHSVRGPRGSRSRGREPALHTCGGSTTWSSTLMILGELGHRSYAPARYDGPSSVL